MKVETIVGIAVPSDMNIEDKEAEKIDMYQDLRIEVKKLWNVKAKVVPVVLGIQGATSAQIDKHLKNTPGNHEVGPLLKTALIGSAHILRKVGLSSRVQVELRESSGKNYQGTVSVKNN